MDAPRIDRRVVERAPKTEEASPHDELLEAAEVALAWMKDFDRDAPVGMLPFEREAEVRVQLRTAIRKVRREQTVPCSACGDRFPGRDLVEVEEDHESLTWFVGDRLCGGCVDAHGGIS